MRALQRNKVPIKYALYQSVTDVKDSNNNYTGEKEVTYSTPVVWKCCVTNKSGDTSVEIFGTNISYDKVIVTDWLECPIDEHSRLWVDNLEATAHDYEVKRVFKSLNSVSIAIKRVDTK